MEGVNSPFIGSSIQNLVLGPDVRFIPPYAFYGCTGLGHQLSFPQSLQRIGANAFNGCTNITGNIAIPDSVVNIGEKAFYQCDNILSVSHNADTVGKYAFSNCDRLVSVTMGDRTKAIGNSAFSGCFRLQSIGMGDAVEGIGNGAFSGCVRLQDMQFGSGLRTLGDSAFYGCSLIHDIVLPEGLTTVGDYAFAGCSGVSGTVEFPSTTASIGSYAFNNSGTISRLVMRGSVPPVITANTFATVSTTTPVAVPCGAVLDYYTTNHWENFSNLQEDAPHRLTALPENPVMGTAAVSQQPTCSNPAAIIAATAYSGYHFLRWSDGNPTNPRQVSVTQDTAFTAIFVVDNSYITVQTADASMGGATGGGLYGYMMTATLTATAAEGYHFLRWSDGNTQNPRNVIAVQDSVFTANFDLNFYAVNVSVNHQSMGSATGNGSYAYLHEMQMEASASYGYHFEQWNDGSTDNPRSVTVTRDTAFMAQFAANLYSISATSSDPAQGSAYGGGTYAYGTTATLSATPAYGFHFSQWSDGVTDNPRTVGIGGNADYTAIFAVNTYDIAAVSGNPAVGNASGGGTYAYLSTIYLTATPNTGYHFTQWSDGTTDNPRMVSVTQNATYTAQFAINSYAVQVASGNSAMGSASGQGTYTHGSTATLAATAAYGYHFSQWSDGNSDNPRQLVVTDSVALTALFDYNLYTILTYSTDATTGSVSGGGQYAYLSQVALTGQPAAHHHFVLWADGSEENPRTLTLTRDTVLTAHFALDTHSLGLVTATPERGTLAGEGRYAYGSQVYVSATAAYGYHFSQWSDGNTQNPRRVVVGSDTLLTALFGVNQYTLGTAVNNATMGSATSGGTYDYLTALTLQATANYGYHFVQWSDGATGNPRMLTLTRDTSLTALFAVNQYYVNATADSGGSVSGGGWYSYLSPVTLHATAAEHHHFVRWSDGSTPNPRQLTLTRDTTFAALFEADARYTIAAVSSDEAMGRVSGAGQYYAGSSVTLSATAAEHHRFRSWADGNTDNPRTVVVLGDALFSALFEPEMHTVSVVASNLSMGQVTGSGSYAYGSTATIEARAFGGYACVGWSDGSGEPRRTISVTSDTTFTALFAANNGINSPNTRAAVPTISVQGRTITVVFSDSDYETATTLYDALGHPLARRSGNRQQYTAHASGIYLLRTASGYTVKVVVR